MKFELSPLPYPKNALEPHISAETLDLHYDAHHAGYMKKLKKAIEGKPEGERSLEELILTLDGDVFNFAAQVWNHTFYWNSMSPDGGGEPDGDLRRAIDAGFGSIDNFRSTFVDTALGTFGSGWTWLVMAPNGRLQVRSTSDADNPMRSGSTPILTLDVWEHAYYVDYRNERKRYVEAWLDHLVNWSFAAERFAAQGESA